MAIKSRENLIGAWSFVVGVILAILVGVFAGKSINPLILGVLALLGIIVGFAVNERDSQKFLLASVSLVLVSFAGIQGFVLSAAISGIDIGEIIASVLGALLALFVPATIVVALKSVFGLSSR
mgnify:CR=1 FL=1